MSPKPFFRLGAASFALVLAAAHAADDEASLAAAATDPARRMDLARAELRRLFAPLLVG